MNLYLIGYRGSGKSTVAPHLAKRLGWECVDADDLVEAGAGISIAEIFAESGEAEFRKLESQVIESLSKKSDLIVSLGGGAPTFEANQNRIASSGKSVYLSASLDVLWARISGDQSTVERRPDLTDLGGRAEVEQVMSVRAPIYKACADYMIDVDELSPEDVADAIVHWLQSDDKMSGPSDLSS